MAGEHPDNANLPLSNRPETILGTTISFITIAFLAIGFRLYMRYRERIWGWDDLFVFLAGVSTAIGSAFTCMMPAAGSGKHFWTLTDDQKTQYFKHIWETNVTYTSSTTFIKLAILFQYLRLFDMQGSTPRRTTIGMLIFISTWGTTFFFLAIFSCNPIEKNWKFDVPGKCVGWGSKIGEELFATFTAHSSSNMLLDIIVLILPIPFLRTLRVKGKTRIGLVGLFIMGGIVVAVSCGRLVVLCINRAGTVPIFDPTFAAPTIFIFSVLEVNIAILCASIPIFWPLVSSLATNKILVVNEIEIRTSRRSSRDAEAGFVDIAENGGRISRMSVTVHGKEFTRGRRSSEKRLHHIHLPRKSTSSPKRNDPAIELGRRPSQDSSRGLAMQSSPALSSYEVPGPDAARSGSIEHYNDRFVSEWVVPDFEGREGGQGMYRTTVERAELPYDYIKALER
ncbi:hypothetical protein CC78DRAFT_614279 [Lojkania enalia]|uniref:Rhodopsin domain-containing protein n=1 Tax=Lojkania enalia TaxID=147567 RepID=A0A9P4KIM5_9PLEO|nr:hypothetical protein CC78DRAFT_614279 [Didymosphaeria enalia]